MPDSSDPFFTKKLFFGENDWPLELNETATLRCFIRCSKSAWSRDEFRRSIPPPAGFLSLLLLLMLLLLVWLYSWAGTEPLRLLRPRSLNGPRDNWWWWTWNWSNKSGMFWMFFSVQILSYFTYLSGRRQMLFCALKMINYMSYYIIQSSFS